MKIFLIVQHNNKFDICAESEIYDLVKNARILKKMTLLIQTKLLLISLFCMLLTIGTVTAQAKELKVGLGELDYPPFYFEKDGKIQGAAVEIAEQISSKLGHRLVYERFPWARVQYSLERGIIDMMILYFKTPEREKSAIYADIPHIYESSYLFVTKESTKPAIGNLQNLKSHKFGNVRGYSHGKDYDAAAFLNKQFADNEILLLRMLVHGRIDIAVGNKPVMLVYAKQENLTNKITFLTPPIDKGPNYFAFSKAREDANDLAKTFSEEIRKFISTDAYKKILEKHGFDLEN